MTHPDDEIKLLRSKVIKAAADAIALQEMKAKLARYEKVVQAAKEMSQRLQLLPWRNNKESRSYLSLSATAFEEWNYGACQKFFEAVKAIDE